MTCRKLWGALAVVLVCLTVPASAHGFSGNDPFASGDEGEHVDEWFHQLITFNATQDAAGLKNAVFHKPQAHRLAWYTDYIDSYGYNPIFWALNFPSALTAHLATIEDLGKIHFDDLSSRERISRTWDRYTMGTIAGLIWAADINNREAGRLILGTSLHAIEDFYAHSNWIDAPERRNRDWFESTLDQRNTRFLFTGQYEENENTIPKHHGKINPACGLLGPISWVGSFCDFIDIDEDDPNSLCAMLKQCNNKEPIARAEVGPFPVPGSTIYLAPGGIALDNNWMANAAVRPSQRNLSISGDEAFNIAFKLAQRSSTIWMRRVFEAMEAAGPKYKNFYLSMRKGNLSSHQKRDDMFEKFGHLPFQFLSAGPYPTSLSKPKEEWYLRLKLQTTSSNGGGTDANVFAEVNKQKQFLLDYIPGDNNPLFGYSDFESGDNDIYTIGPFKSFPKKLGLFVDGADAGEVVGAIFADIGDKISEGLKIAEDAFSGALGLGSDEIKTRRLDFSYKDNKDRDLELSGYDIGDSEDFFFGLNGGSEGRWRVNGTLKKTGTVMKGGVLHDKFTLRLRNLDCLEESDHDQSSDSDEPFLLSAIVPFYDGKTMKRRKGPFDDVDTGDRRAISQEYDITVPQEYGVFRLVLSLHESDFESAATRKKMLDNLVGQVDKKSKTKRDNALTTLGAALAADWGLGKISVYAFNRGPTGNLRQGFVLDKFHGKEIKSDRRHGFSLDKGKLKTFPITAVNLQRPVTSAETASLTPAQASASAHKQARDAYRAAYAPPKPAAPVLRLEDCLF